MNCQMEVTRMKYKGSFCWHGESHVLYTEAKSEAQAFQYFCRQLGRKLEYLPGAVACYFRADGTRYNIEEVNE